MASKFVYAFGAGSAEGDGSQKELLGGKGAGLAEMSRLGIPVPPGFTITTEVCAWFQEHGGMTRENGQRFRDMILSRGGTEEAGAMYRAFRGRDPSVQPLLEQRGLTDVTSGKAQ